MKKTLIKIDHKGNEHNYGPLPDEVIAKIIKGFAKDLELGYYEKKGVKSIYIILNRDAE